MKVLKALLVGQPNVGKSSILNALTGSKVIVSNYPGTTVDLNFGELKVNGIKYMIIDTPGIYSLTPSSEEEKVTDELILKGDYDFIIQITDATAIGRSLIMTYQLAELGKPLMLVLNFNEEAEKRGIKINISLLEELTGIPIVKVNPLKKRVNEILERIEDVRESKLRITYDDHIESAILELEEKIESSLSKRGIAVKLLENDTVALRLFGKEEIFKIIEKYRKFHPVIERDIMVTRAGYAFILEEKVTKVVSHRKERLKWLDKLLINNSFAAAIFSIFIFTAIFLSLFYIGGWFQENLGKLFESLNMFILSKLENFSVLVKVLMENSLIGLGAGLSIAVPYVGIFYFILALMEDIGLLSRFVISMNSIMKRIGLTGKSIIPIMLGIGCTVPAIRVTRILTSFKDRLKVSILFMMIPCSSRNAIIFGVVGKYAGIKYAISIYIISAASFILASKLLSKIIGSEYSPMIEELPPYRKPVLKNLMIKAWIRMSDFIYIVIPLLIIGGMIYGLLQFFNFINPLVGFFDFLTVKWLDLPSETIIPILYGFLQKDLVPAMLGNAFGTMNFSSVMTEHQLFIFGLATTFQIPCIISFGILIKEFGVKKTLFIWILTFICGMHLTGAINKVLLAFH